MKSLGASLHLGATLHEGMATFRVWAPNCRSVEVVIEGRKPEALTGREDGVFERSLAGVGAATRYQYRLDGERYRGQEVMFFSDELTIPDVKNPSQLKTRERIGLELAPG